MSKLIVKALPDSVHGRVSWFVSDWNSREVWIFDTKKEALSFARYVVKGNKLADRHDYVHVDWIPANDPVQKHFDRPVSDERRKKSVGRFIEEAQA